MFRSTEWIPGDVLGTGNFSTVRLATPKKKHGSRLPPLMAVKSSKLIHANMLLHEKAILLDLKHCPYIIRCFGHDHTTEKGEKVYNLFLEYAAGGTLADKLKKQPTCRFQEPEIRRYTRSILESVNYIHARKYVHRDPKPENILLCFSASKEILKIADFGVAMRYGDKKKNTEESGFRGTIGYLSPEALAKSEQEPPSDVWAIGCIVAELLTGAPVWQRRQGENMIDFPMRMALEMPQINSEELSPECRDFLGKIFIKNPSKRWTAQMLLGHPFVADQQCEEDATPLVSSSRSGRHHISIVEKFRRVVTCQRRDLDVSSHGITTT